MINASQAQVLNNDRLPPNDANGLVERFLNTWIVEHSPEHALEFVNPDELAKPFTGESGPRSSSVDVTRSILAMWLVSDHGMVNLLGHGLENHASALEMFQKLPQIEAESLQSAIFGSGERAYDMFQLPARANEAYGVVFQFRHAPRDAVVLIVVRDPKKGWAVSRLLWWVL
jgi:hypothetical protein